MEVVRLAAILPLFTAAFCYTLKDCPDGLPRDQYLVVEGSVCYYFMMLSSHDHTRARQSCSGLGGQLAVIRDERTQRFLQSTILTRYEQKGPVWIGLTSGSDQSHTYTWDDGVALQYTNWAPGQPPSVDNACVAMETNQGGVWMAYPCHLDTYADIEYPFVCQFPLTSSCRHCGDISNRIPCTELDMVFAPYSLCPTDTPYCMNDIYSTAGDTQVYKRCVDLDTCHNLWYVQTSSNAQCTNYNANSHAGNLECHLCCYGDHCNSGFVPAYDTWYRPAVTTTTTTTTTSMPTTDTDECATRPCLHGGTCHNTVGSYSCVCTAGYTGHNCAQDINECANNPCRHSVTCHNTVGSYTCVCRPGFTGHDCDQDINECANNPCQNGATCRNSVGTYTCDCTAGYEGQNCDQDIDECVRSPCKHGATCSNTDGNYICLCTAGYEGQNCDQDVDECANNPCHHNATCRNSVGSYSCVCTAGYTGRNCDQDIDECTASPCHHSAFCSNTAGSYYCRCPPGYTGGNCDADIDECSNNPCQNNATCHNQVGGYTCECAPGYGGSNCEWAALKSSTCFTCGDHDAKTPCGRFELFPRNPVQCPNDKPYCMNDIYQDAGQQPAYYKRCVDEGTCYQQWYIESSDKMQCFEYDPAVYRDPLKCHLCCYGDECNHDLLPNETTLYKP